MSRDWADALSVRIYQSVVTDDKLKVIYHDKLAFGWYVSLLLTAKAVYPAPAFLPASLPRKVRNALIDAGVLLVSEGHYTLSGLVKEMTEAPDTAQRAGGIVRAALAERDGTGRFVAGVPAPVPTDEEDDGRADLEAYLQVRRRPPSPAQKRVLDDVLSRHDVTGPQWAADLILSNPGDPIGAVINADREWRESRKSGAIADERASTERHRRKPGLRDPLLQEIGRAYADSNPVYRDPEQWHEGKVPA